MIPGPSTPNSPDGTGKKPTSAAATVLDTQYKLRRELAKFMRETRLAQQPALTQQQLSERIEVSPGKFYTYSIVTNWENAVRNVLHQQAVAWAKAVGIDPDLETGPLARFAAILLPDAQSKPNKGERVEREVNARLKKLRQERNLSIREMGELTGINYSHYGRIEANRNNISVGQLRLLCERLNVSYEYLIDGTNEHESVRSLRAENAQLRRENELLEQLRQQNVAGRRQ